MTDLDRDRLHALLTKLDRYRPGVSYEEWTEIVVAMEALLDSEKALREEVDRHNSEMAEAMNLEGGLLQGQMIREREELAAVKAECVELQAEAERYKDEWGRATKKQETVRNLTIQQSMDLWAPVKAERDKLREEVERLQRESDKWMARVANADHEGTLAAECAEAAQAALREIQERHCRAFPDANACSYCMRPWPCPDRLSADRGLKLQDSPRKEAPPPGTIHAWADCTEFACVRCKGDGATCICGWTRCRCGYRRYQHGYLRKRGEKEEERS